MKKLLSLVMGSSLLLIFPTLVLAAPYMELGYSALTMGDDSDEDADDESKTELKTARVQAILGTEIGNNFAIEGVIGTGVKEDSLEVLTSKLTFEFEEFYGVYARPFVNVTDNVQLFGRIGYHHFKSVIKVEDSVDEEGNRESSVTDNDIAYGFGAALSVTETLAITADYMNYYDYEDLTIKGFTLGLRFGF
ncbi:MAG: outer membrane beta-barrel protein [Pseudomonadota bacterium]